VSQSFFSGSWPGCAGQRRSHRYPDDNRDGSQQGASYQAHNIMEALFGPYDITFDSKETVINLNDYEIAFYPLNHIDALRSLTNPSFILVDEDDFLPKFQQDNIRHVAALHRKARPFHSSCFNA
jgi:hypothetical protein